MKTIRLLLAAGLTVLLGCASSTESKTAKLDPKTVDWNQRIGSYTYEQALADLGRPAVIGESGEGKTAEWILRRSPQVSFGFGVGHGVYGPHSSVGVGAGTTFTPPPSGEYLRLKFDKEGKLKEWNKVKY